MNHFDAIYLAAMPVLFPVIVYEGLRHGKYRRSLPGMFGANLPRVPLPPHRERVWMNSVSLGETIGAVAVFEELRRRFPDWEFISTTTTETGQDLARRALAAHHHDFAPADFSWNVGRFLDRYRPTVLINLESELWPNRGLECVRRGIRVFIANCGLSARSAGRHRRLRFLSRGPFSTVTAFLMQSEAHAARIRSIVGDRPEIHVTGNVKFDSLPQPLSPPEREELRRAWGIAADALVVLAGSTHPGEEGLVHAAFRRLRETEPDARLVIAPRNPERFADVVRELAAAGAGVHRLSTGQPSTSDADVLVMDRIGVLARSYGAADIALVGGTWNPQVGGHNLLEPAAHSVPVIHGPHMHKQADIRTIMQTASTEVADVDLAGALLDLAHNEDRRHSLGTRGHHAASSNQGAAARTADIIAGYLRAAPASPE